LDKIKDSAEHELLHDKPASGVKPNGQMTLWKNALLYLKIDLLSHSRKELSLPTK